MMISMDAFHDTETGTMTYILWDSVTKDAAVIDPVLNFEVESGKLSHHSLAMLGECIERENLSIAFVLETHVHADHLSAAERLKTQYHCPVGIGHRVTEVQKHWFPLLDMASNHKPDGSAFDLLLKEGDRLSLGKNTIHIFETPGHTPCGLSYLIGKRLFVGDSLFMPNLGTARADFPGGDAKTLYQSIQKIYRLPEDTEIYVGHVYPKPGEALVSHATVLEQRRHNTMLSEQVSEEDYVAKRKARDAALGSPKLLYPSLQCNLNAGQLPPIASNGRVYFKIPVNLP